MLLSLSIRDIVLIDRLDLEWQPTLCTLTGETGAGKSILLDALGLATGARGDAGLVRQGCAQGSVTAIFHLTPDHPLQPILIENGLDEGGRCKSLSSAASNRPMAAVVLFAMTSRLASTS